MPTDRLVVRVTDRFGRWAERAAHVEIVAPPSDVLRWSSFSTWIPVFGEPRFPRTMDRVEFPATAPPLVYDVDDGEIGTLVCHNALVASRQTPSRLRVVAGQDALGPLGNLVAHHGDVILGGQLVVQFEGIDELAFVGGHSHDYIPSDRGFWMISPRVLELLGEPRTPWALLARTHEQGEVWIEVDRDVDVPVGCDVVVAPTLPVTSRPDINGQQIWQRAYSVATVQAVSGRQVRLSTGLQFRHPVLGPWRDGTIEGAEVMFLSRSLVIQGQDGRRAHFLVMPHGHEPGEGGQEPLTALLQDYELRWMGPQKPEPNGRPLGVVGRYMAHFHFWEHASRGAVLRRGVTRDGGNTGVVLHASHGITVEDHVAHDIFRAPGYGWDRSSQNPPHYSLNMSEDVLYRRCLASRVRNFPGTDSRLTGFDLVRGRRMRMEDCRVFGVLGGTLSAGIHWTEGESDDITGTGIWDVVGLRSHNNVNGTSNWQNTGNFHPVLRGSRIANCFKGINHGAYANKYLHEDFEVVGCWWPLVWTAQSWHRPTVDALDLDLSGVAAAFIVDHHVFPPFDHPVVIRARLRGALSGSVAGRWSGARPAREMPPRPVVVFVDWPALRENGQPATEWTWVRLELVEPATDAQWNDLAWFTDGCHAQNRLEVVDPQRGAFLVRRRDQSGTYDSRWNASVQIMVLQHLGVLARRTWRYVLRLAASAWAVAGDDLVRV